MVIAQKSNADENNHGSPHELNISFDTVRWHRPRSTDVNARAVYEPR